jgi:hypothetical protein
MIFFFNLIYGKNIQDLRFNLHKINKLLDIDEVFQLFEIGIYYSLLLMLFLPSFYIFLKFIFKCIKIIKHFLSVFCCIILFLYSFITLGLITPSFCVVFCYISFYFLIFSIYYSIIFYKLFLFCINNTFLEIISSFEEFNFYLFLMIAYVTIIMPVQGLVLYYAFLNTSNDSHSHSHSHDHAANEHPPESPRRRPLSIHECPEHGFSYDIRCPHCQSIIRYQIIVWDEFYQDYDKWFAESQKKMEIYNSPQQVAYREWYNKYIHPIAFWGGATFFAKILFEAGRPRLEAECLPPRIPYFPDPRKVGLYPFPEDNLNLSKDSIPDPFDSF